MKKLFFVLYLVLFSVFSFKFLVSSAFAQDSWVINNFDSNINILKNGQVQVDEIIGVDFGNLDKHGIFRYIPYVYENGDKTTYTNIDNLDVLQDSKKATTEITHDGHNLTLKIGDAGKTISGVHTYEIRYTVSGVILPYKDHDELYWNATGNNWETQILASKVRVNAPDGSIINAKCYEGPTGSTNLCNTNISSNYVTFSNKNTLYPSYGISIVVGLKKGVVTIINVPKPKTFLDKIFSFPSELTFGLSLLAGLGTIFFLWLKYGRDYWSSGISGYKNNNKGDAKPLLSGNEPTIVEFTPPENLPPAIIGVLIDEKADTLDVTSTIIDLASRGFIKITEVPKKWLFGKVDYKLKKQNKDISKLYKYEKDLMDGLFEDGDEVTISSLKTTFYDNLMKVKEDLYQEVVDKKFFFDNPEKIRQKYL
ncbi:MAG TPA: DUF2207 domain-containing protein, partial [Patescibacteria group bacterium]|nr:DUF2207 domain-containing protein [Patescibacteria group bacterium]